MKSLLVTIDGPAGAGKTTVSKLLAQRLSFLYVDTGALYRGVAYAVEKAGIDWRDEAALTALCSGLELNFAETATGRRLYLGAEDITDRIRTPAITMLASAVSARPVVRDCLLHLQRALGRQKRVVFEGRDMGTVVFPDADVKFFLDADPDVRALRRYQEIAGSTPQSLEEVRRDIQKRDQDDSTRSVAPLKPAADAIRIDSSRLTTEEVVQRMIDRIQGDGAVTRP